MFVASVGVVVLLRSSNSIGTVIVTRVAFLVRRNVISRSVSTDVKSINAESVMVHRSVTTVIVDVVASNVEGGQCAGTVAGWIKLVVNVPKKVEKVIQMLVWFLALELSIYRVSVNLEHPGSD